MTDFNASEGDLIDISIITDGDVNASMLSQSGANVVIALAAGHAVTVQNSLLADVLGQVIW